MTTRFLLAISAGLLIVSGAANAQSITVPNFSFEDPAVSGDHYAGGLNNNSSFIPNWTFTDTGSVSGTLDNRFAASGNPGTSDGSRVAFFNTAPGAVTSATTAAPVTNIVAGLNYTLTVALGNTPGTGNYSQPGLFTLNILGNTPASTTPFTLATTSVDGDALIPDGTIEDFSVTLTAAQALAFVGDGLSLQVTDTGTEANGNFSQALFDNVRLTASAVPEPSTWAMLFAGLGLVALFHFRRIQA